MVLMVIFILMLADVELKSSISLMKCGRIVKHPMQSLYYTVLLYSEKFVDEYQRCEQLTVVVQDGC